MLSAVAVAIALCSSADLRAAVSDVQATDVTPRAFSVVWASDEPVTGASVRVFTDSAGANEITADLSVQLVAPPAVLAAGLVKVDVIGLEPDSTYHYLAVTDGLSGQVVAPASGALPAVQTPSRVSFTAPSGAHLANLVLRDALLAPDATTAAATALLLVEVPGVSRHPVSGFVGQGGAAPPDVLVDLNNLFSLTSGENLAIAPETTLRLTAYRGLACPGLGDHLLTRLRRAPATSGVTEAAAPATCFAPSGISVDFDCNGAIGAPDTDAFRGQFRRQTSLAAPNCAFHPDYDVTADLRVGVGDFNLLLFVYGQQE